MAMADNTGGNKMMAMDDNQVPHTCYVETLPLTHFVVLFLKKSIFFHLKHGSHQHVDRKLLRHPMPTQYHYTTLYGIVVYFSENLCTYIHFYCLFS